MKKIILSLAFLLAFSNQSHANEINKITGKLQINYLSFNKYVCSEQMQSTNLGYGKSFLIRDGQNNIIAKGGFKDNPVEHKTVLPSDPEFAEFETEFNQTTNYICNLNLDINNVPKTSFYTFDFGNNRVYTYSYEELLKRNWNIDLFMTMEGKIIKPFDK